MKNHTLLWEKQLNSVGLASRQYVRWLTRHLSFAIEHQPGKEELIYRVFRNCVMVILLLTKKSNGKTLSTRGSQAKNKWTTFLDKLSSSETVESLTTILFRTLVQDLTLREKALKPFWTPACLDVSESLLLPTETDFAVSDSNSSSTWLQKQEVKSPFLMITKTKLQKSLLKTSFPLSTSSLADKWENEVTPKFKTLKIRFYPTQEQKLKLNEFIDTARYVYNKTVDKINSGHKANDKDLRDLLVTANTAKNDPLYEASKTNKELKNQLIYEKNSNVTDWELETPKNIRDNAVRQCCAAVKAGITNLRNGNIKFFRMKHRKKTEPQQTIELAKTNISLKEKGICVLPTFFDNSIFRVKNRDLRKIKDCVLEDIVKKVKHRVDKINLKTEKKINHAVDIVKKNRKFFFHFAVPVVIESPVNYSRIASVDPGIRSLATVHMHSKDKTTITEYKHNIDLLRKLNKKLDTLSSLRKLKLLRRKQFAKIEKEKLDLIDSVHWDFINDLLKKNDLVFFGDLKSHGIVKGGKNRVLNRDTNDIKFFLLKQRLLYKSYVYNKKVVFVNEAYTTKTCSSCGVVNNNVGCSKVFSCISCPLVTGRDVNAAKNIKIKGMI
jgi:putative transposase